MTKEVDLAKRIYEHIRPLVEQSGDYVDQKAFKLACVAAARDILGKSEDGQRDLIFEALCTAMGADWKRMPRHEASKYNVAAGQLREIAATPDEVMRKARRYEHLHPDWPLTPTSLISHWSSLDNAASRRVPTETPAFRSEQEEEEELVPPPPEFLEAFRGGALLKEMP